MLLVSTYLNADRPVRTKQSRLDFQSTTLLSRVPAAGGTPSKEASEDDSLETNCLVARESESKISAGQQALTPSLSTLIYILFLSPVSAIGPYNKRFPAVESKFLNYALFRG